MVPCKRFSDVRPPAVAEKEGAHYTTELRALSMIPEWIVWSMLPSDQTPMRASFEVVR